MLGGKPWEQWVSEYAKSHQNPVNRACHLVGIPMIVVSLGLGVVALVYRPALSVAVALFLVGWGFQFLGHAFERKWPEFFRDWGFLFVGLRWWVAKVTGQAG
jgi:uncharacterized membrane protein YGL010W